MAEKTKKPPLAVPGAVPHTRPEPVCNPRVVVVCGPTATGKTDLAFYLCRAFGGEMVGADSMQIYRGLTIGTAAPLPREALEVPRHLLGFLPPEERFSVADYVAAAGAAVEEIARRGALPVMCGGTGLYIENLVKGTRFTEEKPDPARRKALADAWEREGAEAMLARLARLDPEAAAALHPNNKNRILRALEESEANGTTLAQRNARSRAAEPPYNTLLLGLDYASREALYSQINTRVDKMLAAGLLEEAKLVYQNRALYQTAAQAIGYKEFFPWLEGHAELAACVEKLKQATRNYAKRQLTWFRRMGDIHWLQADAPGRNAEAEALVRAFLKA